MPNLTITIAKLAELGERDLGSSAWFPVEQPRVDLFADATDDHQWIHVDAERAAAGPFGKTIAHGYLTLSLLPRLLEDLLALSDQQRGTNYGIDRARFLTPVPVGSRIRLTGRLLSVTARPDGGYQWKVAATVELEGSERPALVAECLYLSYP